MKRRAILNLRSLIISIVLLIIPLQLGRSNIFASSPVRDPDLKIEKVIEDTNPANEVTNNSIYDKDMVFGDKNAEILLIEYFSPSCGSCRNYHLEVFLQIKSKYIDSGKIAYVMREVIGNKQDLDASILARCWGNKDRYLSIMETVLATQEVWAYSNNYRPELSNIGAAAGIEQERYAKCLVDEETIGILMDNTRFTMRISGFIGTPSFFINGDLIKAKTGKEFLAVIEGAIERNTESKRQAGKYEPS